MTIETTTNKVFYGGTGAQVAFPYTFRIFSATDMVVIKRSINGVETPLTLYTDFTVSGVGNVGGGTVTLIGNYAIGAVPGPLATGEKLLLKRLVPLKQETDYVEGGAFLAESHEAALDRLTCIAQQLQEQVDRSVKVSNTDESTIISAKDLRESVGATGGAVIAAQQASSSEAFAASYASSAKTDRIQCDVDVITTAAAKGNAEIAASAAQGYANSAAANSAAPAWNIITTYSFPDVVAYSDGCTYRCIGTSVAVETPPTSANFVRLTTRANEYFDLDGDGNLMPALIPGYSAEFDMDVNGDIQPR